MQNTNTFRANCIMDNLYINHRTLHPSRKMGSLHLIIGPMYSGKTSSIIELVKMYELSNMKPLVINYAEDNRYDDKLLSTHDRKTVECSNYLRLSQVFEETDIRNYDVILINEGQFFEDLVSFVRCAVEEFHKIVYVCGLDGDFKRNPFQNMMELIPLADEVTKKKSICKSCENGTRAIFSHRISNEIEVKVIGSSNYIPVCRGCYMSFQDKKNKANTFTFSDILEENNQ